MSHGRKKQGCKKWRQIRNGGKLFPFSSDVHIYHFLQYSLPLNKGNFCPVETFVFRKSKTAIQIKKGTIPARCKTFLHEQTIANRSKTIRQPELFSTTDIHQVKCELIENLTALWQTMMKIEIGEVVEVGNKKATLFAHCRLWKQEF